MKYASITLSVFILSACQMKEKPASKGKVATQHSTQKAKRSLEKNKDLNAVKKNVSPTRGLKESPAANGGKRTTSTNTKKKASSPRKTARSSVKNRAKWPTNINWMTWQEGRQKAAEQGKPICLVVYADWCPRCRELAPIFGQDKIAKLSQKFIMIKQDQDKRPDWLGAYQEHGRYVPRVFFFGIDGQLRSDVTSGHPRYPFFYSSRSLSALVRSMSRGSKG